MQAVTGENQVAAIEFRDARKMLADLVNVLSVHDTPDLLNVLSSQDPGCGIRAEEFLRKHGPLRTQRLVDEVLEYARRLRQAWWAKTESDIEVVNSMLDDIFSSDPFSRPIVGADFGSGKWEPRPKTRLGVLAVTLMRSRRMLHRCERPDCQRYFVKDYSRDRYCSIPCSDEMRTKSQRQWALDHRDEVNARRRKPRRKPRQRKTA